LSARQARHLCKKWTEEGFLDISGPAPKTRKYRLVAEYENLFRSKSEKNKHAALACVWHRNSLPINPKTHTDTRQIWQKLNKKGLVDLR